MDFQVFLQFFHWIFIFHFPASLGFPHDLFEHKPDPSSVLKVSINTPPISESQVPHLLQKDAIYLEKLPKIYQQVNEENGANLINVENNVKGKVIMKTVDSVRQTLHHGNKQEIDSYLRYLPRNLHKHSSHSESTETLKAGIGSPVAGDASKHMTHLSDSKEHKENIIADQHRNRPHIGKILPKLATDFSIGQKKEKLHIQDVITERSKDNLHKPNVKAAKPKDGINFAVVPAENVTSGNKVNNMIIAVGLGIVVLGMGIVLGIFGCCCKKQKVEDERDKEEQSAIIKTAEKIDQGLPDAPLDLR